MRFMIKGDLCTLHSLPKLSNQTYSYSLLTVLTIESHTLEGNTSTTMRFYLWRLLSSLPLTGFNYQDFLCLTLTDQLYNILWHFWVKTGDREVDPGNITEVK